MKIKTLLVLGIIVLMIFGIYILNLDKKIYYVNITDLKYNQVKSYNELIFEKLERTNKLEKYINNFSDQDYRITDLIHDIESNKVITIDNRDQTLQNALIKADILTVKMGDNELNYKIDTTEINELFSYCDTLISDIEKMFMMIRKYCKEDIYFIGFYNIHSDYYDEIYDYINLKVKDLSKNYNIKFIDVENLNEDKNNEKIYNDIINKK